MPDYLPLPASLDPFAIIQEALAAPRPLSPDQQQLELKRCAADPVYFINRYVQIYDNDSQSWIPFTLWPFQEEALRIVSAWDEIKRCWKYLRVVALKTRQIGFTWLLADAYQLWKMLFRPITETLIFSQSDEDAMAVLSEQRLKGIYKRLPEWMQVDVQTDSAHEFRLANGSGIRALPESRGGDSRTVTDVVIDEADLISDLDDLIARAEPTLGTKGQLIIIGRAVKDRPNSAFKRLYLAAKDAMLNPDKKGRWNMAIFVPWSAHPLRTQEWYEQLVKETLARTFTLDFVHEHYPATDLEALSARTLDKRYAPGLIAAVYKERQPISPPGAPGLPGLKIYKEPEVGRRYGVGVDPAGGMTDSDDSALCVLDADTLEQVATLLNKVEPTQFGNYSADISAYYFNAPILFELNNHGHALYAQLKERGASLRAGENRRGQTERNPGWVTTERSKHALYDTGAKALESVIEETLGEEGQLSPELARPIIYDFATSSQLSSIDKNELKAPEGQRDDAATAWVLAVKCVYRGTASMQQVPYTGLYGKSSPLPSALPGLMAPTPQELTIAGGGPKTRQPRQMTMDESLVAEDPKIRSGLSSNQDLWLRKVK